MTDTSSTSNNVPTVFFLHGLGLSGRLFDPVIARLGAEVEPVALDLPGFGDAASCGATDVASTVDYVVDVIRRRHASRWLLVGHSMGGKIATVVAARTMAGTAPLFGLAGVVLLAGSPPSPEPMADERRAQMLDWVRDGRGLDAKAARTFIDANVGTSLPAPLDALAVDDLERTSREAWIAWLQRGSREDWSETVGSLDVPSLLVAGGADGDLGVEGQRQLNAPVYPRADVVTLDGAGHLLPLERPDDVASLVSTFWRDRAGRGPSVPADTARTIASSHTSRLTRRALAHRAIADDLDYRPTALSDQQLATLRAVAATVVPQPGPPREHIDLAARLDAHVAAGRGDGWRLATLPPDVEAYRAGLDALAGFDTGSADEGRGTLQQLVAGELTVDGARLSGRQLADWFTDVRDDLVRLWLEHPATSALMRYDGFATGGDAPRQQGFVLLGPGEADNWEPTTVTA